MIGKERETREAAIHLGAVGLDDVEEYVGLEAVEHEVEDVLLRRELEDRVGRPLPLCARFGVGFRGRHSEQGDLQSDEHAARKHGRPKTAGARRS